MDNLFKNCLVFNFRRTARFITKLFDDELEDVGVKYTQLYLLCRLSYLEDSKKFTQMSAAEELGITRTAFLKNVNHLEDLGLVSTVRKEFKHFSKVENKEIVTRKLLKEFNITEKGRDIFLKGRKKWEEVHARFSDAVVESAGCLKKSGLNPMAVLSLFDIVNNAVLESRKVVSTDILNSANETGDI